MFLFTTLCVNLLSVIYGLVDVNEGMKSFSYAHKQDWCVSGKEHELYRNQNGPSVITEQWFTSKHCFTEETIVRFYIDGEMFPTIEANLYMMHGIGVFPNNSYTTDSPWGIKWIGHLAEGGGLYNTMRIPYQKSIRITFIPKDTGFWWYIVRGVTNYPVIIGDVQLPSQAKLVLHRFDRVTFPPMSYVNLAHSDKSGMLFMVFLAGESSDFNYLEGCYRLLIDNNTSVQYLSSGTEDFFLSAYYYNKGLFHTDHSGLTAFEKPGTMSAYKYFVDDPILFHGSFDLIWRVGEKVDNNCYNGSPEKCYRNDGSAYCVPAPDESTGDEDTVGLADTKISSYVWFYEW